MILVIIAAIVCTLLGFIVGTICTNWKWEERFRNNFRG